MSLNEIVDSEFKLLNWIYNVVIYHSCLTVFCAHVKLALFIYSYKCWLCKWLKSLLTVERNWVFWVRVPVQVLIFRRWRSVSPLRSFHIVKNAQTKATEQAPWQALGSLHLPEVTELAPWQALGSLHLPEVLCDPDPIKHDLKGNGWPWPPEGHALLCK